MEAVISLAADHDAGTRAADITELLTDDPAGCDQFEPCPEEGCPPGYRCVYLDCCEMSLCLPLCP